MQATLRLAVSTLLLAGLAACAAPQAEAPQAPVASRGLYPNETPELRASSISTPIATRCRPSWCSAW